MTDNGYSTGNFTTGSQVLAHKFRMFKQGLKISIWSGAISSLLWMSYRICSKAGILTDYKTTEMHVYYWLGHQYLKFKLFWPKFFWDSPFRVKMWSYHNKVYVYPNIAEFEQALVNRGTNEFITKFSEWFVNWGIVEFALSFLFGIIVSIWVFNRAGKKTTGKTKTRGASIVDNNTLVKQIKRAKKASPIKICKIPIIKGSERQHILVTGTTGAGKTNMLHNLLPQIRNQKALVVDMTGVFLKRYYQEGDVILNPFYEDTANWLPWNDCFIPPDYDSIASSFFNLKTTHGNNEFFNRAARDGLSVALEKEKEHKDIAKLLNVFSGTTFAELCKYFEDTAASASFNKDASEMAGGVHATIGNSLMPLQYLKPGGKFSIKRWVANGTGWLFIPLPPTQRDAIRPLVSAWIDIAIKALMSRDPDQDNNNLWFILDEIIGLYKVNSLAEGLAESRKYGGCFVAGMQNIPQLECLYGKTESSSMIDLFNTQLIFRTQHEETARKASNVLGRQEVTKTKESISYGSDNLRDGVSLNETMHNNPIVLPEEIGNLEDLTCFLRLAGNWPITKIKMKWNG